MTDPRLNHVSTQWTLVWRAALEDSDHGRPALEAIITRYWKPLYLYARGRGFSADDAEDATQEFMAQLMNRDWLSRADPAKGRFRTFLLSTWKQFLVDQYRKQNAQRRGGRLRRWSIDSGLANEIPESIASSPLEADRSFMRAWAEAVLHSAKQQLGDEYARRGDSAVFQALSEFLVTPIDHQEYERLARQLSLSPNALRVALHRVRKRFGETLRQIVTNTVEDPGDVDRELKELIDILAN